MIFRFLSFIIFVTLIIANAFFLGYYYNEFDMNDRFFPKSFNVTNETSCNNMDLSSTADCLQSYVKSIYNYTITNDFETLTLEELKTKGGDCKDWSDLYVDITPEGYYGKRLIFPTDKDTGHAIFVLSSDEGYCIIDQITNPVCRTLK